ncbi:MAG: hypothetical protein NTX76_03210 [Alphaproteobacteria bacterium]|nr:hypothetical protein [Alphaproteobacteria bacterium]
MKNAAIASLVFHILLVTLFAIGMKNPFEKTITDQHPLLIEFVQIGEKSAAPKLSPANKELKEPTKKEPEPEPKKPETPTEQTEEVLPKKPEPLQEKPAEKVEPVKEPEPEPKPEPAPIPKKEPEKKPEKKPEPPKKPDKKPDPKDDKKADPKKKDKPKKTEKAANDKAQINLKKDKKPANALDDLLKKVSNDSDSSADHGAPAETVGPVVTATEIDAIRQKIRKCWIVPAGVKGAKDMVVDIRMEIAKDGTVTKADIVDKARANQDTAFRTAAENAQRAVLDPNCNPLPLSKEKYEQWKDLELSFNPKNMF